MNRTFLILYTFVLAILTFGLIREHSLRQAAQSKLAFISQNAANLFPYIPKLDRDFDFTVDYFGFKYSGSYKTDYMVLYTGANEKPELFLLREYAKGLSDDLLVFFDVGASKGYFSLFLSRFVKQVHAFEPYPPVLKSLRETLEVNQIDNIQVHPVGLSDENSTLPFYAPKDGNIYTGSFDPNFTDKNQPYQELELRIGDEIVSQLPSNKVDIMKIDVEGFEKPVLNGLEETIENNRPLILLEVLPRSNAKAKFQNQEDLAQSFPEDYHFFYFKEYNYYSGAYQLSPFELGTGQKTEFNSSRIRNIVACPEEKLEKLPIQFGN